MSTVLIPPKREKWMLKARQAKHRKVSGTHSNMKDSRSLPTSVHGPRGVIRGTYSTHASEQSGRGPRPPGAHTLGGGRASH